MHYMALPSFHIGSSHARAHTPAPLTLSIRWAALFAIAHVARWHTVGLNVWKGLTTKINQNRYYFLLYYYYYVFVTFVLYYLSLFLFYISCSD
jgi:hypothetical protein